MTLAVWMRTAIVALVLAALSAAAALAQPARRAGAPALRAVSLPRDHGAHAGFSVEWWYTAGTVRGSDGHRYFWFATAWSAPEGVVSRVNLLDLGTGATVFAHEGFTLAPLTGGRQAIPVGSFTLARGADGRWRVSDSNGGARVTLTLTPKVPYVLHGRHGLIAQGPGGRSAYYSEPRLGARGTLTRGGHTVTLTGLGWLDHQWGNFGGRPGALRWNWFACQLTDGRDLMLYEFLNARGQASGVGAGTLVSARGRVSHLPAFTIAPLGAALRPAGAKASYPQRWRLRAAGLTLALRSLTSHGFIVNTVVPSFWEAPAAITAGAPGSCIVESSREL